jgi:hypothetical protein
MYKARYAVSAYNDTYKLIVVRIEDNYVKYNLNMESVAKLVGMENFLQFKEYIQSNFGLSTCLYSIESDTYKSIEKVCKWLNEQMDLVNVMEKLQV